MKVVLISTYELGRQPFGLASPAAWLRTAGHEVTALDLSRQDLDEDAVREAGLIAFFVPMHTAARLTLPLVPALRALNPAVEFCAYGLYAAFTEDSFRKAGVRHFLGGEFEQSLCDLADELATNRQHNAPKASVSLARQHFMLPDRSGLPALRQYAHVVMPEGAHRVAGYTEASRGCKHLCRHCPIVPVYDGIFRIVNRETVLADIRQQVAVGAQHITFGDPDFFNGIGHALAIVRELHREFPELTYDATIKIEHLRKHERELATLRDTNCLFVTSAVESMEDEVLRKLEKGHTRGDFLRVVEAFRQIGLTLQPTFVPFTPWTTLESYRKLLDTIEQLELIENVAPIQLAIRLLIPAKSRLLELSEIARVVEAFDETLLVYPWKHPDARVDALAQEVESIAAEAEKQKWSRAEAFERIYTAVQDQKPKAEIGAQRNGFRGRVAGNQTAPFRRTAVPYLNEPWYC